MTPREERTGLSIEYAVGLSLFCNYLIQVYPYLSPEAPAQRELTKIMNVEQVLEEWSDVEEESDSDETSDSEESDTESVSDSVDEVWREATG